MISFILLYFIGLPFYNLAEKHRKSRWLIALIGILIYFAGTFIGGIIITLVSTYLFDYSVSRIHDFLLNLLTIPFGLLFGWIFYRFLILKWESISTITDINILDDHL